MSDERAWAGGGRGRGTAGVSPIVGSILILVIMILAIGGIVAWGVPAIQGLQEQAEYQSVLTQFLQLNSDLQGLRDPQNTRVSTISLARGTVTIGTGDRWVIIGARDTDYNGLSLDGWTAANPASVTIVGYTVDATNQITAEVATGGSFTTLSTCTGTCTNTISLGSAQLSTDDVRIQVKEGTVRCEIWIVNAGRLSFRQSSDHSRNQLHLEMGAVFTQHNTFHYLEHAPAIKDPDYTVTPKDTSLFARFIQMDGSGSTSASGGKSRMSVVFNLVDNYGASRGRPSFDPATMVRLQIDGVLAPAFCGHYDDDARDPWESVNSGNTHVACPSTGPVNLRFVPTAGNSLAFDLNQAVVTTSVRSV